MATELMITRTNRPELRRVVAVRADQGRLRSRHHLLENGRRASSLRHENQPEARLALGPDPEFVPRNLHDPDPGMHRSPGLEGDHLGRGRDMDPR